MVVYFFDEIKSMLDKADEIRMGDCLFVSNGDYCGFFICKGVIHPDKLEDSLPCYELVQAIINKSSRILCRIDPVKGRFGDIVQIRYLASLFRLREIQDLLDNAIRILSLSADLWELEVWMNLLDLSIIDSKEFWHLIWEQKKRSVSSEILFDKFSPVRFLHRIKEDSNEVKYETYTVDSIVGERKYINGFTLEKRDDGIKVVGTLGSRVFDIVYYYDARNEIVGYHRNTGYMLIKSFGMSSFYKEMSLEVYHDGFRIVKNNSGKLGLLNKQLGFLKGKDEWLDIAYLCQGNLIVNTYKSKELITFDAFPEKTMSLVDVVTCEQFYKELFLCTLRNGNQKLINIVNHQQTRYDFLFGFGRITEKLICAESKERFWYIFRYDNICKYLYKSSSFPELDNESGELRITIDNEYVYINLSGERSSVYTMDGNSKDSEKLMSASNAEEMEKVQEQETRLDINVIALVDSNHVEKKTDYTGCLCLYPRKGQNIFSCNLRNNDKVLWIIMNDAYVYYSTYSKIKTKHCFFVECKYHNEINLKSKIQDYLPLMFEVNRNMGAKFEVGTLLNNLWDSKKLNNIKKRIFYSLEEINAILSPIESDNEDVQVFVTGKNKSNLEEDIVDRSRAELWQKDVLLTEIMFTYRKLLSAGFDKGQICEALLILYPKIENKELQSHFGATLLGLRNDVLGLVNSFDGLSNQNILDKLNCDDIQLGIINYYREIKGYTLDLAVRCTIQDLFRNLAYVDSAQELENKYQMLSNREQLIAKKRYLLIQGIVSYGLEREKQIEVGNDYLDKSQVESVLTKRDTVEKKSDEDVSVKKTINENGICILNSTDFPILEFGKKYSQSLFHKKVMSNYFVNNYYEKWNCVLIFVPKKKTVELDRQATGIYEIIGEGNDKRLPQDFGANANRKVRYQKNNGKRILLFSSLNAEYCEFYDEVDYLDFSMIEDVESASRRKIINFRLKSKIRFI